MEKKIQWRKHPYIYELNVSFGSLTQMLENRYLSRRSWESYNMQMYEILIGGNYNRDYWKGGRRRESSIGIELKVRLGKGLLDITEDDVLSARIVSYNDWEGTYGYRNVDGIEDCKVSGMYPIAANWDGKTNVE